MSGTPGYVLRSRLGGCTLRIHGFPCRVGRDPACQVARRDRKASRTHFVAVHCAAGPPPIADRQPLGRERGAFTSARGSAPGSLRRLTQHGLAAP